MLYKASCSWKSSLYYNKMKYFAPSNAQRLVLFVVLGLIIHTLFTYYPSWQQILIKSFYIILLFAAEYFLLLLFRLVQIIIVTQKIGLYNTSYHVLFYDSYFLALLVNPQTGETREVPFNYSDISKIVELSDQYLILTKSYCCIPVNIASFEPVTHRQWLAYIMEHNAGIDFSKD